MSDALLPIAGVLLGVLASYATTSLHERAVFKRTMATRWDERRIQCYLDYTTAVKEVFRKARALHHARQHDEGDDRALATEQSMEEAESHRSLTFESVVLLASTETQQHAHAVNKGLWEIIDCARAAAPPVDTATFAERTAVLFTAMNAFHAAGRRDLGVEAEVASSPPGSADTYVNPRARRPTRGGR